MLLIEEDTGAAQPRAHRTTRGEARYGTFLQTDPIGFEGGMNLSNYVGGDPVNFSDPEGLEKCGAGEHWERNPTGSHIPQCVADGSGAAGGLDSNRGALIGGGGGGGGLSGATYVCVEHCGSEPPQADGSILVVAPVYQLVPPIGGVGPSRGFLRHLLGDVGRGLDRFADSYLRPPEGRLDGESFRGCVGRIAGMNPALAVSGASGIAAGGAFLGYPRGTIQARGGGTSLISSAARGAFGQTFMGTRILGTGKLGAAIGRGLSRVSVSTGAALVGWAAGSTVGAVQRCQ